MDAETKERLAALVEERLAARFSGRTLDGPTIGEVAEYIDDLRARITVDAATGLIMERDPVDPTNVIVHMAPQIDRVQGPIEMTISRDPSDPSRLVVSTAQEYSAAISAILAGLDLPEA